jgi:DNA (cytosine-5)-methyltransferase 1
VIPEIVGQAMSAKWSKGSAGPAGDEHHNLIPCQVTHSLRGEGFDASEDGTGRGTPIVPVAGTICRDSFSGGMGGRPEGAAAGHFIAIPLQEVGKRTGVSTDDVRAGIGIGGADDPMFTLQAGAQHGVGTASAVRRLTPTECERLQGFPDDWTAIPWGKKPAEDCPDGPRYKALGNSMAVPCMRWIGERIAMVDRLEIAKAEAA